MMLSITPMNEIVENVIKHKAMIRTGRIRKEILILTSFNILLTLINCATNIKTIEIKVATKNKTVLSAIKSIIYSFLLKDILG